MIFTSQVFLFWFLPAVLLGYYLLPFRFRSLFLTLVSYVFYGWWRVDFVLLMLVSTVIDFICGRRIGRFNEQIDAGVTAEQQVVFDRKRKRAMLFSICANLSLLGYFKYWNFGIDTLNVLLASAGFTEVGWTDIVLPVGISFYTFQSLSYSIDVYRRQAPAVRRFVDFACYISLFPQLVAGPIVRYQTLAAELVYRTHTWEKISRGAFLFQIGFAKKILLADTFGAIADNAFAIDGPTTYQAWIGTFAYSMQIYFDFSGYSDMAIGLGALFGFSFPLNFDSPYKSLSITEFWRRWHISLSTWLRDYLYVPLGGNRRGKVRTYINLMLTMLLGGLWHGAAMTFILWGAYQGAWLAIERIVGKRSLYPVLPKQLQIALTFVIVLGGWVLFRATSVGQVGEFYSAMVGFGGSADPAALALSTRQIAGCFLGAGIVWLLPNSQQLAESRWSLPQIAVSVAFIAAIAQIFQSSYSPFLYFQF
jgi:alginate O-acetyltransferase complex protein AlgI